MFKDLKNKEKSGKWKDKPWRPAAIYLIFGFLWIVLSDRILGVLIKDQQVYREIQTFKGWFFILITAILIYALITIENNRVIKLRDKYKSLSDEVVSQNELMDVFFNDSNTSVVVWDLSGIVLRANQTFKDLIGYGDEIIGKNWIETTLPKYEKNLIESIVKEIRVTGKISNCENSVKTKDGTILTMIWNDNLVKTSDGKEIVIAFGIDITKEKAHEKQMLRMVYKDSLTGIYNRMKFEHVLMDLTESEKPFTLFLVGIKKFKRLNEIHGHQYGDRFLVHYAKKLKSEIDDVTFYRWGGDEFIGILRSNDSKVIVNQVNQIIELTENIYTMGDVNYKPSINMGIASYPEDGDQGVEILKSVEVAFEASKKDANSVETYYTKALLEPIFYREMIESQLDDAIVNQELIMYYQPIYNLKTKEIVSLEMLLRWFNPLITHIGEVIDIAEQTGQIRKIDDWVLEQAFKVVSEYLNDYKISVSVNISTQTLNSGQLTSLLQKLMGQYTVDTTLIILEITEYSLMENMDIAENTISEVKALGFRVALDDFGTKYSSLNYLSKLTFDILKIDKSYVDYILSKQNDRIIVQELIHLTTKMGIKTIGEGIETIEQEDLLKEMGCLLGQGYYFHKPMPFEKMEQLLLKGK